MDLGVAGAPRDRRRGGLVLPGQAALAASAADCLSAIGNRPSATFRLFAPADGGGHSLYFLAQAGIVVATLVFCLRLFCGGPASGDRLDQHEVFLLLARR